MKKIEVALLSDAVNNPVILLPNRKFPGVLIQGDSLRILYDLVEEMAEALDKNEEDELYDIVQRLKDILNSRVQIYEETLREQNMELPY